jgi:hypothetical protein
MPDVGLTEVTEGIEPDVITVTVFVAVPHDMAYVIMVVPEATPVTSPVSEPTVAAEVLLLVQVPPLTFVREIETPVQTLEDPDIAEGVEIMFTVVVVEHPVPKVYVIVAVPANTPVNTPVEVAIVATEVLLLVQVPPPASVNAEVAPVQTVVAPLIAAGDEFTVTVVIYITDELQPAPEGPDTVSEYVPVAVGVAVGFAIIAVNPAGPLHEYEETLADGLAMRLTDEPVQMGPLFEGAAVGTTLTVTLVV